MRDKLIGWIVAGVMVGVWMFWSFGNVQTVPVRGVQVKVTTTTELHGMVCNSDGYGGSVCTEY